MLTALALVAGFGVVAFVLDRGFARVIGMLQNLYLVLGAEAKRRGEEAKRDPAPR